MEIDEVLEILEKYKLRIPPTTFYELKADIVNMEDQEPILDKLRAEIEELKNKIRKEHNYGADAVYGSHVIHGINAVLEIFDKHEVESEDE